MAPERTSRTLDGADRRYLSTVMSKAMLSEEEELDLARRWRNNGEHAAMQKLISAYLRLVVATAARFRNYGLPMPDLIQEGNVGLMLAVNRFDPERGVRFSTYAAWWIRSSIQEYVLRNWRLVKIATTKAQRKLFFNLRRLKKNLAWLTPDETRAVARDLGVSPAEVKEMEQRLAGRDLSFDPTPDADEEEAAFSPAAYLPAPNADPAEQVEAQEWEADSSDRLHSALQRLDERSRDIVQRRWMTEDKATLHELADKYGVSAERIRQIEANALTKLRGMMAVA